MVVRSLARRAAWPKTRLDCDILTSMFFVVVLIALYAGRKVGWRISPFLYRAPQVLCVVLCVGWALLISFGLRLLIDTMHPGVILKALSFGAGFYVASPNYGLLQESTIPALEFPRHMFMKYFTPSAFMLSAAILAFAR
jgi:hypothetical protein